MSTAALDQSQVYLKPFVTVKSQWRLFKVFLVSVDILALLAAFGLAYVIRFQTGFPFFEEVQASPEQHQWLSLFLIPLWLLILGAFQAYNIQYLLGGTQEYARVFNALTVALSLTILGEFFVQKIPLSRGWITVAWVLSFVLVCLARFGLRRVVYRLRRRGFLSWRTLIIGTDDEAAAIAAQLQSTPTSGAQILGFVANHTPSSSKLPAGPGIVGSTDALPALVKTLDVEQLIVSTATLPRTDLITIFETFGNSEQVELRFSSGLYELFTTGVRVKELGSVPLVSMNKIRLDAVESAVKSVIDRTLAVIGLVGLLPLFAIIAILIKLDSPGPVIYRRRVLGQGGRQFDGLKFRTMHMNGEELLKQRPELLEELQKNFKLKDDPRITRMGKWVRRLSFDELPQLLNVLFGQMSLVGPRMITPEECEKYGRLRMNLLTVKPGLTGLWQIKGRSDVPYDERVRLDMYYIRNYTLWLDLQILLQTIPVVLRGKGAY